LCGSLRFPGDRAGSQQREEDRVVKEFRDFLFRGNIIELAVAVVIAGAFGAVIASLVADIITPVFSLFGIPDFSSWTITVGNAVFRVGNFLNALITFLVVALAIFFIVVKPMNAMMARMKKPEADQPAGPTEIELLAEIRDELRKRSA
jgi:large conductance mechanosensitive channel